MNSPFALLPVGLAAWMLMAGHAAAQDFKGEVDLETSFAGNGHDSLAADLGAKTQFEQSARFRLMWNKELAAGWSLDATYQLFLEHGGETSYANKLTTQFPGFSVDPEQSSLFDLQDVSIHEENSRLTQRIDRLALTWSGTHLVVKAGRQALTWGGGLVFRPFDLFNPFAPNATYTRYKPGTDMLYGQYLFNSGADLQAVMVPRRDPVSDRVDWDQSSTGFKWHGFLGQNQSLGLNVLLARDYQDEVIGLGLNGSLGGASWTMEAMGTHLHANDAWKPTFLANAQMAWVVKGKNINGFVEGFYNGLGRSGDGHDLVSLPTYLSQRLARGELFTVSRAYLAMGANVEYSPLLTLKPMLIGNLDDGSALFIGQATWSMSQNTALITGFQTGIGAKGTEYGGLAIAPGLPVYDSPASRIYVRLGWYF